MIFDDQKYSSNQLSFKNKVSGKRFPEYDEFLSGCGSRDNPNCYDYSIGMLKAARIRARHRTEEYWRHLLQDFRKLLFKRYCTVAPCDHDRYEEFFIKVGDLVSLQYQAFNGENGQFCHADFCSTMWLSTRGFKDYAYYG